MLVYQRVYPQNWEDVYKIDPQLWLVNRMVDSLVDHITESNFSDVGFDNHPMN